MLTLSKIDANAAQGNPKDSKLILGGIRASPGGTEGLNETAVKELREKFVAATAREWVVSVRSAEALETFVEVGSAVASLLGFELGHWEEARDLQAEVVAGCEELVGPEAESTLGARSQLAVAMSNTGQLRQARALIEQVLESQLAMYGPESENVLPTQGNLAHLLDNMGDSAAALLLYEAVVAGFTKLNGPEANQTLEAWSNLAGAYEKLGRHAEAQEAYTSVLAAQKKLLGARHPSTMNTQFNLALLLYQDLGEQAEGLVLLREVAAVQTTVLGAEHDLTKDSVRTLAVWERAAVLVIGAVVTCTIQKFVDDFGEGTAGEITEMQV